MFSRLAAVAEHLPVRAARLLQGIAQKGEIPPAPFLADPLGYPGNRTPAAVAGLLKRGLKQLRERLAPP